MAIDLRERQLSLMCDAIEIRVLIVLVTEKCNINSNLIWTYTLLDEANKLPPSGSHIVVSDIC